MIKSLIQELRDYNTYPPKKKIILDQLDPLDVANLIKQIAAFSVLDSVRGSESQVDESDIEKFIQNVINKLNNFSKDSLRKSIEDAKKGIIR